MVKPLNWHNWGFYTPNGGFNFASKESDVISLHQAEFPSDV